MPPDRPSDSRRDAPDTAAKRRRRSLRLSGYDYAQAGAYFITICTEGRACLFGEVANGTMRLNAAGQLAVTLWNDLTPRFVGIELDAFVVMPNHVHGVIVLPDRTPIVGAPLVGAHDRAVGAPLVGAHANKAATRAAPTVGDAQGNKAATRAAPTVGDVVGAFKSLFTVEYIRGVKEYRWPAFDRRVWQRNYYEHIIRDEAELARVRRYIDENPLQWELDQGKSATGATVGAPLVGARGVAGAGDKRAATRAAPAVGDLVGVNVGAPLVGARGGQVPATVGGHEGRPYGRRFGLFILPGHCRPRQR